ncbi:alpha/beta fold hydrolase [Polyangium aurulentum]|uniref:alpha/beta fold hydrolase n=1 Tax=Polyangium aurulentum TaxID=2567896 RepID=UPI0010ADADCD|nr:alpha/beta hydrolase [Polyangium aurulentum]UQA61622.1 alpha/beta hydrolase [Polyangium aurulentum]
MAISTPRFFAALLCVAASLQIGCISPEEPGTLVPPTADQDPALPQRTITVAGEARAIHTETFGDPSNPALFLLHDMLADYRAFQVFEALSDRYFVVMWDQRGHGLSERIADGEYTVDSIVEEIDALKALHSPNAPVTLIGHGFGAAYAALYMSRRPASVSQAVLMEPVGLNGQIYNDSYYSVFDDSTWNATIARMLWQNEALTATDHETIDYRALSFVADARWTKLNCDNTNPPPFPVWRPGGYVEILRERMIEGGGSIHEYKFDFAAGLSTFPAMVRILVSDCSALGFDFQNKNNRPLIQHSEIVVIRASGHRMFIEQPSATLIAVKDYLSEY